VTDFEYYIRQDTYNYTEYSYNLFIYKLITHIEIKLYYFTLSMTDGRNTRGTGDKTRLYCGSRTRMCVAGRRINISLQIL